MAREKILIEVYRNDVGLLLDIARVRVWSELEEGEERDAASAAFGGIERAIADGVPVPPKEPLVNRKNEPFREVVRPTAVTG